jgi:hypothetical protein
MSNKKVIDDLVQMLKNIKEIKEQCKTNKKIKILFDSELKYQKNDFIMTYNNEFCNVLDNDICKTYCKQLLIEIGIPEIDLK